MSFVWHAVTFPTHTKIQGQALRYLPVVFDENIAFVLYSVANPVRKGEIVFERAEVLGVLHVVELRHLVERAGHEAEQVSQCQVIAGRGRTGESRKSGGRIRDRSCGNDGVWRVSADRSRY